MVLLHHNKPNIITCMITIKNKYVETEYLITEHPLFSGVKGLYETTNNDCYISQEILNVAIYLVNMKQKTLNSW